jgi:hypothetical protein
MALMSGCKSQQPTVSVPKNDSTAIHRHTERDSVYIHDSVVMLVKGDTVYKDRWRTEYKLVAVQVTDTLYKDKEVIVQLPPERYIPPWAWWTLGICIAMAIIIAGLLYFKISRFQNFKISKFLISAKASNDLLRRTRYENPPHLSRTIGAEDIFLKQNS